MDLTLGPLPFFLSSAASEAAQQLKFQLKIAEDDRARTRDEAKRLELTVESLREKNATIVSGIGFSSRAQRKHDLYPLLPGAQSVVV
jgi:hypothetical protein